MTRSALNRTGQGLSVNVIILIALGLIILIIAVLLVSRSGKNLSESATTSCISKGGSCKAAPCQAPDIEIPAASASCTSGQAAGTPAQFCCRYDFSGTGATS